MLKKVQALIEVRKMTMLWFAIIFGVMVFNGSVPEDYYMSVFTMVFGFYFAKTIYEKDDK